MALSVLEIYGNWKQTEVESLFSDLKNLGNRAKKRFMQKGFMQKTGIKRKKIGHSWFAVKTH